jgi:hypothetical protein
MLVSFAIALAAMSPAPSVSEYFPLVPGTVRTYDVQIDARKGSQSENTGRKVVIEGKELTPVTQVFRGTDLSTSYYGIENDTVLVLATSDKKLLNPPIPVLKVGSQAVKWEFEMDSPILPPQSLRVYAVSTPKGKRKVLGVERDVVEVRFDVETPKDAPMLFRSQQIAVYAAGVGLVDWDEVVTMAKLVQKKKLTLVRIETPAPKP